jgi:hypothetical protein
MEDFIERHDAYLEGRMRGFCILLLGLLTIFEHILGGGTCGDTSCYFWGYIFYYFMDFWHGQNPNSPHLLGFVLFGDGPGAILGFDCIISCGVLHLLGIMHIHPWSWLTWDLHMCIGYMHFVDHLLFLEVGYGTFCLEENFIVYFLMHLGGCTL